MHFVQFAGLLAVVLVIGVLVKFIRSANNPKKLAEIRSHFPDIVDGSESER